MRNEVSDGLMGFNSAKLLLRCEQNIYISLEKLPSYFQINLKKSNQEQNHQKHGVLVLAN